MRLQEISYIKKGKANEKAEYAEAKEECEKTPEKLGPGWSWSVDLGIYCLQFISMAFGGQKPKKISAVGSHYETGMDDTVTVLLQYPGGVHGSFTCSITVLLSNTVSVSGKEFSFTNGMGMNYEAKHVQESLQRGLKESPVIPLAQSELLADILEEVRKVIGITFPQDKH
ncbi:Trans-1; 2-dihydrobenzene-1; 2-diol dehydrogenase [Camelus dromedarius]|uniref:Trans-1 n=1 Tax=Camelus dromedarius TaxID=9838 RepID=A0A5N4E5K7_CAMDR|nr:Trans-1; 2-dihydrobenzene-1; 2-diol dehydrogenase [Camelus dromedarius]